MEIKITYRKVKPTPESIEAEKRMGEVLRRLIREETERKKQSASDIDSKMKASKTKN